MEFNRCFSEDPPGSRERARINPGGPLLLLSFSLTATVHTRARRVRVTRVSAAVLTRRHAPRAPPPLSPVDACRRPRATPEWPYGKLIIVITYEPRADRGRIALHPRPFPPPWN